jgi:hypothetical protein
MPLVRSRSCPFSFRMPSIHPPNGVVTFTYFSCQPRCALKDRKDENQQVRTLDVGANFTKNGLFLASVTTPSDIVRVIGGSDRRTNAGAKLIHRANVKHGRIIDALGLEQEGVASQFV